MISKTLSKKLLLIGSFLLINLIHSALINAQTKDYLGQTPPNIEPIKFAPNIVSVDKRFDYGISFSPKGDEVAFGVLNPPDFTGQIFYSNKTDNKWSKPILLDIFNDSSVYLPFFTPDGNHLLFTQDKSKNEIQVTDVSILDRQDTGWVNLRILPEPVSSYTREGGVCMTLDKTLYFSSNRMCDTCLADLYSCRLNNEGKYEKAEIINELSTLTDEESIFVSAYGEFAIFRSFVYPTKNDADLFISFRDINNNWSKPQILDSLINKESWEQRPFVTFDNQYLFFTRRTDDAEGNMESDIYWVSTDKILKPFVFNEVQDTTLHLGEDFNFEIARNTFKDIGNEKLNLTVSLNENEKFPEWLKFNKKTMALSGSPNAEGIFKIKIRATDTHGNFCDDCFILTVKEK